MLNSLRVCFPLKTRPPPPPPPPATTTTTTTTTTTAAAPPCRAWPIWNSYPAASLQVLSTHSTPPQSMEEQAINATQISTEIRSLLRDLNLHQVGGWNLVSKYARVSKWELIFPQFSGWNIKNVWKEHPDWPPQSLSNTLSNALFPSERLTLVGVGEAGFLGPNGQKVNLWKSLFKLWTYSNRWKVTAGTWKSPTW